MADIIPIEQHLPKPDAELVETMRTLLSEAQAARIHGFAAVYVSTDGHVDTVYHFINSLELTGATALLHQHALNALSEE